MATPPPPHHHYYHNAAERGKRDRIYLSHNIVSLD